MENKQWLRSQIYQTTIGGRVIPSWNHWRLYLDVPRFLEIATQLERRIRDRVQTIDYLCPIPKSGIPLGTLLAERLQVPLLNFWWGDGIFCQEHIRQGAHIVLLDPDIKSGRSLHFALTVLDVIQPTIECLATIIYHDTYPHEFTMPVKQQWLQDGKIIYLYRMSELKL